MRGCLRSVERSSRPSAKRASENVSTSAYSTVRPRSTPATSSPIAGAELEAVAAAAGREDEAVDLVDRARGSGASRASRRRGRRGRRHGACRRGCGRRRSTRSRTSASNVASTWSSYDVGVDVLVLLREAAPDEQVAVAVLGRRAHVDAVDLRRRPRTGPSRSGRGLEDDVLLARDLERQLDARPCGRASSDHGPGGEHDGVALDAAPRRRGRRAPARPRPRSPRRACPRARRRRARRNASTYASVVAIGSAKPESGSWSA